MKKLLTLALGLCLALNSFAQYETIQLNYEKSYFGENQALPAGKHFIITGEMEIDVPFMEVQIFTKKGLDSKKPVYKTDWKRMMGIGSKSFSVPINYKLKGNAKYDVLVRFYRRVKASEKENLRAELHQSLDAYVGQSFSMGLKKMNTTSTKDQLLSDLNQIVFDGMSMYKSRTVMQFSGFSDVVENQIAMMSQAKLKSAAQMAIGSPNQENDMGISDLKKLLHSELNQYLNKELYILLDDLYIDNYETEKIPDYLSLNVGYAGNMISAKNNEFNYASAPYAGISIPFSNEVASPVLNRFSFSFGAFLKNMKDKDETIWSGPIFKVPTYAGIGIRPYRFIKINLGAAFLEEKTTAGGFNELRENVIIAPMIGVGAEFNISISLPK